MKARIVLACAVLMFSAAATCLAQDDSSPSDAQIANDEVQGAVSEALTGIPTDATSLALSAAEAAGVAEAITGPIGAFASAFSSSYTAPPALDEAPPARNMDGSLNWYDQQMQVEQEQQSHLFDGYPYPQVMVPAGPSFSECYGCQR